MRSHVPRLPVPSPSTRRYDAVLRGSLMRERHSIRAERTSLATKNCVSPDPLLPACDQPSSRLFGEPRSLRDSGSLLGSHRGWMGTQRRPRFAHPAGDVTVAHRRGSVRDLGRDRVSIVLREAAVLREATVVSHAALTSVHIHVLLVTAAASMHGRSSHLVCRGASVLQRRSSVRNPAS